jgi:hypothetical protein
MLARKLVHVCFAAVLGSLLAASEASAASKEVVEFRLTKWKAAHFDSEKDAQKVLDTLKQLGCEVRKEAHGGHSDVVYRCVDWKLIKSKTHDEAHKWEGWLKVYGFETKHTH